MKIATRTRHWQKRRKSRADTWVRFRTGLALLVLILGVGAGGYMLLGLSLVDAVYQTVITVSTVGYREIGEVTGPYKAFTTGLIMSGAGTALYTLGVLIELLFEGKLDDQIRRRRMLSEIDRLTGHVILAGFGQVGRAIYSELNDAGYEVVVIDRKTFEFDAEHVNHVDHGIHIRFSLTGEATDDRVLLAAGLERAGILVLALDHDADNLFVVLTARTMRPEMFIVVRANDSSVEPKLRRAGADRVVNPHQIGGAHMASVVISSSRNASEEIEARTESADPRPRSLMGWGRLRHRRRTR